MPSKIQDRPMIVQDIIDHLEVLAPVHYAEDFDNVGLLIGDKNQSVTGVLVTLDTLESVVDEAINKSCNLIVSFHPIIFSALRSITGKNYVERVVQKAIKNDLAIYAVHTALDNMPHGVGAMMCHKLGLAGTKILLPKPGVLKKLVTYVPLEDAQPVRNALFGAGAGHLGKYSHCSFNTGGLGSFMGDETSHPAKGEPGRIHFEEETQVSVVFPVHLQQQLINTLLKVHPYEEVAYDIVPLDNFHLGLGMGMIGHLEKPMDEKKFLKLLKSTFKTHTIRHSALLGKPIKSVAVLGGSGSFGIAAAKAQGADVYVTADLKYHDFFKADGTILLADIGHYESEQFTKTLIVDYLRKKITNFAPALMEGRIILSETNTNPVKYF